MTKGTKMGSGPNWAESAADRTVEDSVREDSGVPDPQTIDGIRVVAQPAATRLSPRQLEDYHDHRCRFLKWALNIGKDPEKGEGYATTTIDGHTYRLSQFYRYVWDEEGGYTTNVTHDHADAYIREIAYGDTSTEDKSQRVKGLKILFRWRSWEFGDSEWEPELSFSPDTGTSNPRDYLTRDERRRLREAALGYGSVPAYNALSPEERDRWKAHLAQRFEKPKKEIGPADFERANSWKIPSLFWTALDAGLRPVEIERASVHWVDTDNEVLRIPREESSKNRDNWIVSLTQRTANALDKWLLEREQYEKYEGSEILWLNRRANPYKHYSLNRILRDLCKDAQIDTSGRSLTMYAIRHSVGTLMAREEGLAAAQAQLRHKSERTTMRYDQAPVEDRRDALDRMG